MTQSGIPKQMCVEQRPMHLLIPFALVIFLMLSSAFVLSFTFGPPFARDAFTGGAEKELYEFVITWRWWLLGGMIAVPVTTYLAVTRAARG